MSEKQPFRPELVRDTGKVKQLPVLESRGFVSQVRPPLPFMWETLNDPMSKELNRRHGIKGEELTSVIRYYAQLLRIQSWKAGIDWDASRSTITLPIPNILVDYKEWDDRRECWIDGFSVLLRDIVGTVSLEDLVGYFSSDDR